MRSARMAAAAAAATAMTLLGTAGVITATTAGAATAPAISSWSQTNYNAAGSRANLAENILTAAAMHRVRFLRQLTAGSVPSGACIGPEGFVAPVLTGGRLFAVANGRVVSYDAATGRRLWSVEPPDTFSEAYSTLAESHGLIIIDEIYCGSASEPNGAFIAYQESTGKLAWHSPYNFFPLSKVSVSGGFVLATGQSADGQFVVVRRVSNGTLVWQRQPAPGVQFVTPLIVGHLVIQPDAAGLVAYNLATGATVWTRAGTWQPELGDRDTTAALHLYVVNAGGQVVDLQPETGATRLVLSGATSVLAVDSTRTYAVCGTGNICGYDSATGTRLWSISDASTLAAEAGGVLYLSDGKALNAATGALLKQIFSYSGGASGLVIGEGRVAASLGGKHLDLFGLPGS